MLFNMNLRRVINFTAWMLISWASLEGKKLIIICDHPVGKNVSYFSHKGLTNSKTHKFNIEDDKYSHAYPILIWDTNEKFATFVMRDSNLQHQGTKSGDFIPLHISEDQLTFVGEVASAPVMFTIYPNESIAFFTQHSIYNRYIARGARGQMMYAKCSVKTEAE